MKNWIIIILAGIVVAGYLYYDNLSHKKTTADYEQKIDSISMIIENQKEDIKDYKITVSLLDQEQDELEKRADSLAQEASKPIPCTHKVIIQEEEIKSLRGALNKCKEAKVIQVKTIGICDELSVNHELIISKQIEMIKITKKERKKSFLKGLGIGAGAGMLLTLLIAL